MGNKPQPKKGPLALSPRSEPPGTAGTEVRVTGTVRVRGLKAKQRCHLFGLDGRAHDAKGSLGFTHALPSSTPAARRSSAGSSG